MQQHTIDNIVIGNLIEGLTLEDIGVDKRETTVHINEHEATRLRLFLPSLLVHLGLFKSTSEIKRIHKDRIKSTKILDQDSRNLWRTLDKPELTYFKIGRRIFWLIVGDLTIS